MRFLFDFLVHIVIIQYNLRYFLVKCIVGYPRVTMSHLLHKTKVHNMGGGGGDPFCFPQLFPRYFYIVLRNQNESTFLIQISYQGNKHF